MEIVSANRTKGEVLTTTLNGWGAQEAFHKAGVVTMVGDWTNGDKAIGAFLEAHGRSGVPLYLWYAHGKDAQVLPQILTPSFLAALAANNTGQ